MPDKRFRLILLRASVRTSSTVVLDQRNVWLAVGFAAWMYAMPHAVYMCCGFVLPTPQLFLAQDYTGSLALSCSVDVGLEVTRRE